jgi:hypothetical protein
MSVMTGTGENSVGEGFKGEEDADVQVLHSTE